MSDEDCAYKNMVEAARKAIVEKLGLSAGEDSEETARAALEAGLSTFLDEQALRPFITSIDGALKYIRDLKGMYPEDPSETGWHWIKNNLDIARHYHGSAVPAFWDGNYRHWTMVAANYGPEYLKQAGWVYGGPIEWPEEDSE